MKLYNTMTYCALGSGFGFGFIGGGGDAAAVDGGDVGGGGVRLMFPAPSDALSLSPYNLDQAR